MVRIALGADREIARLPEQIKQEAVAAIEDLPEDPFPPGVIPMQGYNDTFRIRVGNDAYRIVYRVDRKNRVVTVFRVRPRPSAYEGMKGPGR